MTTRGARIDGVVTDEATMTRMSFSLPLAEDWPTLDALSVRYIYHVLEHTHNNRTHAAAMLGLNRRTLTRLLRKVKKGLTPLMQTARHKEGVRRRSS